MYHVDTYEVIIMNLDELIKVVEKMSSLKPSSQTDSYIDKLLKNAQFVSQDGAPSRAQLLGQIEKIGVDKVFKNISLDDRKNFLANISSAYRAFPDIQKIVQTAEQTTTANVAAYPVPLGQKPMRANRKEAYESSKSLGVGAHIVGDGIIGEIDDLLNEGIEDENLNRVVDAAQEKFWEVVASMHPEIKTGDLDPMSVVKLESAMAEAIAKWVMINKPQ
jgi:hypothetical protein